MSVALFESIKIVDGKICNLPLHIARMNKALQTFYPDFPLLENLHPNIPGQFMRGLVKWKVEYNPLIYHHVFSHYQRKIPASYKYVYDDNITYSHKYADRNEIEAHQKNNEDADEIVMVKHNMLTDASYSNICLYTGTDWHTPKYPLLKGVKRQQLIHEKKIIQKVILMEDLHLYKRISFINALNELGERELEVKEW